MNSYDIALMAHLMRRAGFGASYKEIQRRAARGYEATVEDLLHPEQRPGLPMDMLDRYYSEWKTIGNIKANNAYWLFRMLNSPSPLQEKMVLFWHSVLCVGNSKCDKPRPDPVLPGQVQEQRSGSFP